MNNKQLTYTLSSIISLILSLYAFYKSNLIFGISLAIIGIVLGVLSTEARKNRWLFGILATIGGIILGWLLSFFFYG
jgi:uncharacterized membrane protein